jgi:hypothetical protein
MDIDVETFKTAEIFSFCNCSNSSKAASTYYQMAKNHYNNICSTSIDFETKFKQNHALQLREALLLTPTPSRFDNNFCLIGL